MSFDLAVIDWELGRSQGQKTVIDLKFDHPTARDIIAARVEAELDRKHDEINNLNARVRSKLSRWAVVSGQDEAALNGTLRVFMPRTPATEPPSSDSITSEIALAVRAFEAKRFIMLFDREQVRDLDQRFKIRRESSVTFIRLTPLRGG